MKKNKMMRIASVLLVAVLLSTCAISGTFAKYTTSVSSDDSARVATWGFTTSSITLTNLFAQTYDNVASGNEEDVIAPGTENSTGASFQFKYDGEQAKPEVKYTFSIGVQETCDPLIKANKNIIWYLNGDECDDWADLIADIKALSGDNSGTKVYDPGVLPDAFTANDETYTITWQWKFDDDNATTKYYYKVDIDNSGVTTVDVVNSQQNGYMTQDQYDTYMGNQAELDDVSIQITITATQVD